LMLFHDSRGSARVTREGELVLLEDQDRSLWDVSEMAEGRRMLERALGLRRPGPYQVQAAIAELHTHAVTDWPQISLLYDRLLAAVLSPVVELNRAVAVAFAYGFEQGLELLDAISGIDDYPLLHAARGDLLRRIERPADAASAYRTALSL